MTKYADCVRNTACNIRKLEILEYDQIFVRSYEKSLQDDNRPLEDR